MFSWPTDKHLLKLLAKVCLYINMFIKKQKSLFHEVGCYDMKYLLSTEDENSLLFITLLLESTWTDYGYVFFFFFFWYY